MKMKFLGRAFVFSIFSLWLTSQFIGALFISGGVTTYLMGGLVFALLDLIVKPMLKILFIPINFLTLGLAGWFVNVIILYLLTVLVYRVSVSPWTSPAIAILGISIHPYKLGIFPTYVIISLAITAILDILHKISDD